MCFTQRSNVVQFSLRSWMKSYVDQFLSLLLVIFMKKAVVDVSIAPKFPK